MTQTAAWENWIEYGRKPVKTEEMKGIFASLKKRWYNLKEGIKIMHIEKIAKKYKLVLWFLEWIGKSANKLPFSD